MSSGVIRAATTRTICKTAKIAIKAVGEESIKNATDFTDFTDLKAFANYFRGIREISDVFCFVPNSV